MIRQYFKRNKIFIFKLFLTLVMAIFVVCSIKNMVYFFKHNMHFHGLAVIYICILVLATFVVEFSPYILYKYIVHVFPAFKDYYGRMWVYLIVGTMYMTPDLNIDSIFMREAFNNQVTNSTLLEDLTLNDSNTHRIKLNEYLLSDYFDLSFITGILMIVSGIMCYLLHRALSMNQRIQENQLLVMSKNYDDFNNINSTRESLNFNDYRKSESQIELERLESNKSKTKQFKKSFTNAQPMRFIRTQTYK